MPNNLSDNEVKKALEDTLYRIKGAEHLIVPKEGIKNLCNGLEYALDLINRLEAENERLTHITRNLIGEIKAEAYTECIEKVKEKANKSFMSCQGVELEETTTYSISKIFLDEILEEMVGNSK